jgi:membrane protein YqaA with SNARE-associated domain
MMAATMLSYAFFTFKHSAWQWVERLGGPGLVVIGIIDSSVIPFPGGMDFFTILLAMSHRAPWWYCALMATIGSLIGSYLTYRVGHKGGEETLEKKFSGRQAKKIYAMFEKRGFLTVAFGSIAPPPVPAVPFFLASGVLQYPLRKFLAAVLLGRSIRYAAMTYLGSIYGRAVFHWMHHYYRPVLYSLLGLVAVGAMAGLYYWRRFRRLKGSKATISKHAHKAA